MTLKKLQTDKHGLTQWSITGGSPSSAEWKLNLFQVVGFEFLTYFLDCSPIDSGKN